jgi:5-epi-alpha-selinene synthase
MQSLNLYCPFSSRVNPHLEKTRVRTLRWAEEFGLVRDEVSLRRLLRGDFCQLMARCCPNSEPVIFQILSDFITNLFFLDDEYDEGAMGLEPGSLSVQNERVLEVLLGGPTTSSDRPLVHAFSDIHRRLRPHVPKVWMRRFVCNFQEYLEATVWEAGNRAAKRVPDLATYMLIRRFSGAVYPCLDFIDVTEKVVIPIEVRHLPVMQRLLEAAGNILCWANDIFSAGKEQFHGDIHNLVLLLQRERSLSPHEALVQSAEFHDAEVRRFIEDESNIPPLGAPYDAEVKRYIEAIHYWIRGNLDWSRATARYAIEYT